MSKTARHVAMDLLSRREHSCHELSQKLSRRDFSDEDVAHALLSLQQDNLLNDARFAESYVNQRQQKGYGPLRIRQELIQKGIAATLIDDTLQVYQGDWFEIMQQQREKKFGRPIPEDYREKMKQARFLQNRGFSPESVMRLFR